MQPTKIATWSDVEDRQPTGARVADLDLVIVRFDDNHSVLYGRCLHRGALTWPTAASTVTTCCAACTGGTTSSTPASRATTTAERLNKFSSWIDGDDLMVDLDEILAW